MGRLPRVYIEGILYYVTSRSGHNQNIFEDFSDYQEYISLIDKYKRQYGFKLFAYALLPTHLHILLELKNNVPISNIMHDINSLYTKIFNSRYGKKGHLFQERFRTALAEKEPYLLPLVRYIHLNPQRTNLVNHSQDYPYSSYSLFLEPEKRQYPDMREEIEEVFTMLKGREGAFAEYVSSMNQKEMNEFRKSLRKKGILGSKDFGEHIKKIIEESTRELKKRRPLSKKARMMYLATTAGIILLATIIVGYFHKRSTILKSKYDKTAGLYLSTLQMLKREMNEALKAKKDIASYQWKIRLTEKALEKLRAEKRKILQAQKEIEGYAWRIKLTQIGGPKAPFTSIDVISFSDGRFRSKNLSQQGFTGSQYSKSELRDGRLVWETIQTNSQGEAVSWRGEWDGEKMQGIFSWRSAKGTARDFSFVSVEGRIKR